MPSSISGRTPGFPVAPTSILMACTLFSFSPRAPSIPSWPRMTMHFASLNSIFLTPLSNAFVITLTAACVMDNPCIIITFAPSGNLLYFVISFTLVVQLAPLSFVPSLSGKSLSAALIICRALAPPIALVVACTPGSFPSSTTRFFRSHLASPPSSVHTSFLAASIHAPTGLIVSSALST